jgi:hypothetical protein
MQELPSAVKQDSGSNNKAGLIAGLTLMCVVIVAAIAIGVWGYKSGKYAACRVGANGDQDVVEDNGAPLEPLLCSTSVLALRLARAGFALLLLLTAFSSVVIARSRNAVHLR